MLEAFEIRHGFCLSRLFTLQSCDIKFLRLIQVLRGLRILNHLTIKGIDVNVLSIPVSSVLSFFPSVASAVPVLQLVRTIGQDVLGSSTEFLTRFFNEFLILWEECWVNQHGLEIRNRVVQGDFQSRLVDGGNPKRAGRFFTGCDVISVFNA